jgi:hypothetical protein
LFHRLDRQDKAQWLELLTLCPAPISSRNFPSAPPPHHICWVFPHVQRFLFLLTKRMSDRQIPGKGKIASLVHAWLNL